MTTETKPAKWNCQEHDVHTSGPQVWSHHVREAHGGVDPISGKTLKGRKRDGTSGSPATPATTARPSPRMLAQATNGKGHVEAALKELEAERAILDDAISALKKLVPATS